MNEPREIAVIHCRGHQKGDSDIIKGNNLADRTAKTAAKTISPIQAALIPEAQAPTTYLIITWKEATWAK